MPDADPIVWMLVIAIIVISRLVQFIDWLGRRRLERYRKELAKTILEGLNLIGMLMLISDIDGALDHSRRLKDSVRILAGLPEDVDA